MFTEEQRRILKSQVLLPISIAEKHHAMLGPIGDPSVDQEKLTQFFPTYDRYKPIGNTRKPKSLDEIHSVERPHPDQ